MRSVARVAGVGVDPVLEGIDDGHPGEEIDDSLDELSFGAEGVGVVVEDAEMFAAEEFHGHAGDFAEFHGGAAEKNQIFVP